MFLTRSDIGVMDGVGMHNVAGKSSPGNVVTKALVILADISIISFGDVCLKDRGNGLKL